MAGRAHPAALGPLLLLDRSRSCLLRNVSSAVGLCLQPSQGVMGHARETLQGAQKAVTRTGRLGEVCTPQCLVRAGSWASRTWLFTSAEPLAEEDRGSAEAGHNWERAQPWQEAALLLIPSSFRQSRCTHAQTKDQEKGCPSLGPFTVPVPAASPQATPRSAQCPKEALSTELLPAVVLRLQKLSLDFCSSVCTYGREILLHVPVMR